MVTLTVAGRKTGRKLPRLVQFVVKGDAILLIPFLGKATSRFINVMSNPEVKITVRGRSFRGMVKILDEKGLQGTIALFTKKYGKRNLDNYYPTKDAAVEVSIQE
ncbi:MAG: nitroreductase family deazaflavin-dependent oxidoreductase [Thaumarchaeota archaeon]|nr:nitroreductase family deazaflavin-dependent oxidoreductase [Nitrososphaerota archaeon]